MKFPQIGRLLLAAVCALGSVSAGGTITGTAVAAGADPGRTDYSVSGERVIWMEPDSAGVKQVHALDRNSGASLTLTTNSSAKDAPAVGGLVVVWADKGNEQDSSLNWDIYSFDLEKGTRTKLNKQPGQYGNPTTDGVGVVWYERSNYGSMMYHDLASGVEADLGEGRFPELADGKVVYKNARDGGLSLLDLSSGVTRPLISLGGANYVDWFVFNGSHVLLKQKNGSSQSKFVLLSINDLTAEPVDLTEMKAAGAQYAFMSIGDGEAVFQDESGGASVLKQVNLSTYQVTTLPALPAGSKLIGISGNKLLYSTSDNSIEAIALEGTGTDPGTGTGTNSGTGTGTNSGTGSSAGGSAPVVTGAKDSQTIGAAGGTLTAADGWARLEISAGTFPDNTAVSLAQAELESQKPVDQDGRKLQKAGSIWQVQAGAPFQLPALLAIRYPKEEPWTSSREKLGIYQYDSTAGVWTYIGGVTAAEEDYVRAKITASGLYAVMLRDVEFPDMANHWARQEVEVLAARGIVNGMNGVSYAPKGTLTRAQFTKLLAAALQLKLLRPDAPTFRDVSSANWSYGWVEAAASAGIVTGDAGLFRGDDPLTREQMMTMLMRAITASYGSAKVTSDAKKVETELAAFKDSGSISSWARESVAGAVELKLVQGSNQMLHPAQSSTRAEAAVLIYKLLAQLKLL
ncbi:hypothetical protein PSTEL_05265 [Paenibacillus stellifer]|uniref:SLH domain-containing protein n=2 Tax=Paenibacillus stellifer TaxID=169760 RepID=A0A089LR76_9BACL|nr:hypothetical protein PSTEL_05265 [Paenibacillus stellifer]